MKDFADDNFKFDKNGRKFAKQVKNTVEKGEIASSEQFLLFIRPSKTGRIMGSPMAGGPVGGRRPLLCPEHISKTSYGYEMSWVDRSHQGGVQCAGIITLASLIFQLLPFVFFHT